MQAKQIKRTRIHSRVRARISGTAQKPRLVVFRSNKHIYAQLIDDVVGKTIAETSDFDVKEGKGVEKSKEVGKLIAQMAKAQKISKVVFDRGGFLYHGNIEAIADGAREGGLQF